MARAVEVEDQHRRDSTSGAVDDVKAVDATDARTAPVFSGRDGGGIAWACEVLSGPSPGGTGFDATTLRKSFPR